PPRGHSPNVKAPRQPTTPSRAGGRRAAQQSEGRWGTRWGGGTGKSRAPGAGAGGGGGAGRTIRGNRQQANGNRQVERVCERR
ncbi:hypothetical protein P2C56_19685, partial [Xanthomonas perforans]